MKDNLKTEPIIFPTSFQCTDSFVFNRFKNTCFLGRKKDENTYRLIGGFVDPSDLSLELAAARELKEEFPGAVLVNKKPIYLGSFRINDKRYVNSIHKVMTALFLFEAHESSILVAGDDIEEIKEFKIDEIRDLIIISPCHHILIQAFFDYLYYNN